MRYYRALIKEYFDAKEKDEGKEGWKGGREEGRENRGREGKRQKREKKRKRKKRIFFYLPPKPENLSLKAVWYETLEWNRPCSNPSSAVTSCVTGQVT